MKRTDFRMQAIGISLLALISMIVLVQFLTVPAVEQTSITTTTNETKTAGAISIQTDANLVLDSESDTRRGYWLTGREANIAVDFETKESGKSFKVTAGLDPCGRRSQLEVSALTQVPVNLDSASRFVIYPSSVKRFYVRSLGPACLFDTDPRNFFGRVEISVVGMEAFNFEQ